jgi:hypothetical protein
MALLETVKAEILLQKKFKKINSLVFSSECGEGKRICMQAFLVYASALDFYFQIEVELRRIYGLLMMIRRRMVF